MGTCPVCLRRSKGLGSVGVELGRAEQHEVTSERQRIRKTPSEAIAIVKVTDGDGLKQGGTGNDEKWSDSRCIWKVEPKGPADRLNMGCERGIKGDSKLSDWNNENKVVISQEDCGEAQWGEHVGAQSWTRCPLDVPTEALSGQLEIRIWGQGWSPGRHQGRHQGRCRTQKKRTLRELCPPGEINHTQKLLVPDNM